VYDIPMDEVVQNLNLSDDVKEALTMRQGELGKMLQVAELLEQMEFRHLSTYLEDMGISFEDVLESQKKAYNWRAGMA
ncbi:MAG: EAL domain-containing protein, partial [Deltaproteobacteria bacterium]